MAEDAGFSAETVKAVIENDRNQADYGAVIHISMVLVKEEEYGIWADGAEAIIEHIEIEPIQVGAEDGEESEPIQTTGEEDKEIAQLRRKVEKYYGLESHEVEIKLKVREE